MKKMINIIIKFNNWFNKNLGWFFTNGRKQYTIDNLPDRK